ncbi:MAG: hypothetical protein MJ252_23290 [archaeon]|nr:hypothetical protein [archaeon]
MFRPDSFKNVETWLKEAKSAAKENCTVTIIGNKSDLMDERKVQFTEAAKFCQDNNLIHFECSALSGENIEEVFGKTAKSILQKIKTGVIEMEEKKIDNFIINEQPPAENNSGCSSYC